MSQIHITTYCDCKLKTGHLDGDRDQIICNTCDQVIENTQNITMAELAKYNDDYQKWVKEG